MTLKRCWQNGCLDRQAVYNDVSRIGRIRRSDLCLHFSRAILPGKSVYGRCLCWLCLFEHWPVVARQMKIYVAGPMRGVKDLNRRAFHEAAEKLRIEGYTVFDPAAANLEGLPLGRIMAYVLGWLCQADAIAMLPRWWRSGGARIEWMLARYLNLKIIYL
jgi:hypothetical protein